MDAELRDFLAEHDLLAFETLLVGQNITSLAVFGALRPSHLQQLGLKVGDRVRFERAIGKKGKKRARPGTDKDDDDDNDDNDDDEDEDDNDGEGRKGDAPQVSKRKTFSLPDVDRRGSSLYQAMASYVQGVTSGNAGTRSSANKAINSQIMRNQGEPGFRNKVAHEFPLITRGGFNIMDGPLDELCSRVLQYYPQPWAENVLARPSSRDSSRESTPSSTPRK